MNGVTFSWPRPSGGSRTTRSQRADGHRERGGRNADLAFLGSATNGPASRAPSRCNYSGGSTSTYWLGLSDWTLNGGSSTTPAYGNKIAAATTYRNCAGCTGGQQP